MTSNLKCPKALVTMHKSPIRDNILYKLDEDYINDLKRETRKKNFGMADYLPNSVRRKSEFGAKYDTVSRNQRSNGSLFNASTYCDTTPMPHIRAGSISELGSALANSNSPSMLQLKVKPSQASFASGTSRSTNTSFLLPNNIVPVSGSFLFFDETKKRLSDLGDYKNTMRNRVLPETVPDIFERNKHVKRIAPGVALR